MTTLPYLDLEPRSSGGGLTVIDKISLDRTFSLSGVASLPTENQVAVFSVHSGIFSPGPRTATGDVQDTHPPQTEIRRLYQ